MTKSELIKSLAKRYPKLPLAIVTSAVNILFTEMSTALINHDRIELRGFGTFSVRKRAARIARNPKTSENIEVGDRHVVYFRLGKEFRDRLNA